MNTFGCVEYYPLTFVLCVFTEGSLAIVERNRKDRERYAFLFDNMLIMCKPTSQRPEYKFKEKLLIKHIDVTDIEDSDGKIVLYPIIQWLFPEGHLLLAIGFTNAFINSQVMSRHQSRCEESYIVMLINVI